jgi:hypothetical protein
MNTLQRKRDDDIDKAKHYAKNGHFETMLFYIERAERWFPVTKIQLWRIQNIIGPYKFEELELDKFNAVDTRRV